MQNHQRTMDLEDRPNMKKKRSNVGSIVASFACECRCMRENLREKPEADASATCQTVKINIFACSGCSRSFAISQFDDAAQKLCKFISHRTHKRSCNSFPWLARCERVFLLFN